MKVTSRLANFTRTSDSLPAKILRSGRWHWLPVYFLLRLSDLAREGIERSGSYRFADHIYRNEPSGVGPLGKWLDGRLMRMPATRAFRRRYLFATMVMQEELQRHLATSPGERFRILGVPCGLPRDFARVVAETDLSVRPWLDYTGMDLDPAVLRAAAVYLGQAEGVGLIPRAFHHGNALVLEEYPEGTFHCIACTGLGEFLTDDELSRLYRSVFARLKPGGVFYTSATVKDAKSEALLELCELRTQYRDAGQLRALLDCAPWSQVDLTSDPSGFQAFAVARK